MATTEERVTNLEETFTEFVKRWRAQRQQHRERHDRLMASLHATFDDMAEREAEQDVAIEAIIETMERRYLRLSQ